MSVIKTFQCDICFKTCGPQGNITIELEQKESALHYHITTRTEGLNDLKAPAGVMVRHICETCNNIISGRADILDPVMACAVPGEVKPPPWEHEKLKEDKDNG